MAVDVAVVNLGLESNLNRGVRDAGVSDWEGQGWRSGCEGRGLHGNLTERGDK